MDWGVSERSSTAQIVQFETLNSRSYLKSGRDKYGNLPRVTWGPNGYEPCQPGFLIMSNFKVQNPETFGKRYTPIDR